MPKQPSNQYAPLPGHAVRDAVLDAARRKRSLRPYVIPGVLIGGLAAPIVTMGTADQLPVPIPGAEMTTTDTTATTPTETTTAPTETTTTPTETTTTGELPDEDPVEPDPPVDPPAPVVEPPVTPPPAPPAVPAEPTGEQLLAKVEAAERRPGRGKKLRLTAHERRIVRDAQRRRDIKRAQSALGSPGLSSAGFEDLLSIPGAAKAVPQDAISNFQIPPFLLPIYQAAGAQYGIRWEVLAAINEIETNYGRNLNISSAGAQGWMQFMPPTWEQYGTDANRDGRRDPYNPVDAIFAAARYLKAAGANTDLRRAIFAYNHADWYVRDVLKRARRIAAIPPSLTDALAQMADGYFPIAGTGTVKQAEDGVDIKTARGSAVIAVQDGEIVKSGVSKRLGRYIRIRDGQGTVYTYGNLQRVGLERDGKGWARRLPSTSEPVPDLEHADQPHDPSADAGPAEQKVSAWTQMPGGSTALLTGATSLTPDETTASVPTESPERAAGHDEPGTAKTPKSGRRIVAGTVLGRAGDQPVRFEITPRGGGRIDPRPIISGWKLLQTTALFRVKGRAAGDTGQVLLMSKEALEHRVLHDPRIKIYEGGRNDVAAGIIDRRVLASLAFLAESGMHPTVTSLRSGHSYLTAGGSVSHHSSGNAVDIAAINDVPIMGHQGKDSITATAVRRLLQLQGTMKPAQIITLMEFAGTDNTFAMGDHDDHIHLGFQPTGALLHDGTTAMPAVLKPDQWDSLVERIGSIENPIVSDKPSKAALAVAHEQLEDAAAAREEQEIFDYDAYQSGVKDPFIPPWLARDQT